MVSVDGLGHLHLRLRIDGGTAVSGHYQLSVVHLYVLILPWWIEILLAAMKVFCPLVLVLEEMRSPDRGRNASDLRTALDSYLSTKKVR